MFTYILSVVFLNFLLINKNNCEVTTIEPIIASKEESCSIYNSINITSTINSNQTITHNGIVYPPTEYFITDKDYNYLTNELVTVKSHTRGCLCNLVSCIRLCCPINHIENSGQRGCFFKENLQLYDYDKLIAKKGIIIGRPCKSMLELEPEEFKLDTYGNLYMLDMAIYSQETYCLTPFLNDENKIILTAFLCEDAISNNSYIGETGEKQKYEYYPYALLISIIFLFVIILIYSFIPELRNLHGKCVLTYVCGLIVGYSVLAFLQFGGKTDIPGLCYAIGFTGIYAFIFSFLWLNAMCVDIYWTFKGLTGSKNISDKKKFIIYSAYTWGVTLSMLIFAVIMQFANVSEEFSPGIGIRNCWLLENWKIELIYLFLPITIIIITNITLFTITALTIRRLQMETAAVVKRGDSRKHSMQKDKDKFSLYLRLFIIMGATWSFEIISWIIETKYGEHWIAYIPDICNALQGFLIFIFIVWKPKVKKLIIKRYNKMRGHSYISTSGGSGRNPSYKVSLSHSSSSDTAQLSGNGVTYTTN